MGQFASNGEDAIFSLGGRMLHTECVADTLLSAQVNTFTLVFCKTVLWLS